MALCAIRRGLLLTWAALGLLVVLFGVLRLPLPAFWGACPFKSVLGWECWSCGGTHAVACLLRGDIAGAVFHNFLLVAALFLAGLHLAVSSFQALALGQRPCLFRFTPLRAGIAIGILMVFMAARNMDFYHQWISLLPVRP